MNLKEQTPEDLAKFIAETNTKVWDAMCAVEVLNSHPVIKSLMSDDTPATNKELLELAKAYLKVELNDEEFANPEIVASEWNDYHAFALRFEELLEEVEE